MPHKSGDKLFIEFSGGKLGMINRDTGEINAVEVFVSVLGASGLTYAQGIQPETVKYIFG